MQRWAIEWGAISQLNRQGVERYTLKIGDHVQITGAPARNADDHQLLMRKLLRPSDGFKWAASGQLMADTIGQTTNDRSCQRRGLPLGSRASWLAAAPGTRDSTPSRAGARLPGLRRPRRLPRRMDLTGYWVSVVTEDWLWRMVTPPKGDVASIPLNAAGRKVADAWDLARDNASERAVQGLRSGRRHAHSRTASASPGRTPTRSRSKPTRARRRGSSISAEPARSRARAVFRDSRLPRGKQAPPAAGVVAASDRSARAPWAG